MNESTIKQVNRECAVVLTAATEFSEEVGRMLPNALLHHWSRIPDEPSQIEKVCQHQPSLFVVDGAWQHRPECWRTVKSWPLKRELEMQERDFLALPTCVRAISRLNAFRLKAGWRTCIIFLILPEPKETWRMRLCLREGADRVLWRDENWTDRLTDLLGAVREKHPLVGGVLSGQKLRVLVAENAVDVFLLLDALFGQFCCLQMSLDNHDECLRDTRKLAAESVDKDFRSDKYDAVVVDMALSVRQEFFAEKQLKVGGAERLKMKDDWELRGIVNDNLDGLAAVKRLRSMNNKIPICIFSNYVSRLDFRNVMRRYWGSRVYDSIVVLPKTPHGRTSLGKWLRRLAGFSTEDCAREKRG